MMDTFFLPHATMGKTDSTPIMEFLRSWKDVVGVPKPKSILIVSAHWDTCDPTVSVFPYIHETAYESEDSTKSHLAKFKYPAPGAPQLGMRVKELLMESGFETVHEDSSRGLDHGAWFPLMLMYPEADIPVCEISIQSSKDRIHHYNMGKALAPLRAEGVLIVGSGGTISYVPPCIPPVHAPLLSWALEFNTWLKDSILTGRHEDVIEFEKLAPHAKMAHPRPDHIYPLIVAFASAGNGAKAQLIHHSWQRGFLCFDSYRFSENVETSF